jgi:hypothetical protein
LTSTKSPRKGVAVTKLLEQVREMAVKDEGIMTTLAELCIPLESVRVIYRIELPDINEHEDTVL